MNFRHHPQFFTATILEWKHLLKDDSIKDIVVESLKHLTNEGHVKIYCFVIMPNHFHLIWQISDKYSVAQMQHSLLRFTAQKIKASLKAPLLESFKVSAKDRTYQIWERNSLSIDLFSEQVFRQKMDYIHNNPIHTNWKLSALPEDYRYSSANYYTTGNNEFGFLTHFKG